MAIANLGFFLLVHLISSFQTFITIVFSITFVLVLLLRKKKKRKEEKNLSWYFCGAGKETCENVQSTSSEV